MPELLPILEMIYFVVVILVIYHLHQQDLDRLTRQVDEILARNEHARR